MPPDVAALAANIEDRLATRKAKGRRRLVALAGPPASGKSTLAAALAETLPNARVVPQDGFHLDNRLLDARGLWARKGSPPSFDAAGLRHLLLRLQNEDEVVYPLFDRARDISVAGAGCIGAETGIVVVEGNYLLLDAPVWRDLAPLWDVSVVLDVPQPVLRDRLLQRWREAGLSEAEAVARADGNDLPNARLVADAMLPADLRVG